MGKTIFITEKPSVAQEYRKVLGVSSNERTDGYISGYSGKLNKDVIITWAVGHLISICSPEEHNEEWKSWRKDNLPMIPNSFKYKPLGTTYPQFKVVKSLYTRNDIDAIYYAGDSGREGIYIQALIRNQIFKSTPKFDEKVVWIDSYTEESILDGIKNAKPYKAYQPMIDSGYERAKSDWLIGMNLTEAFTLTSGGYKNVINVGRVMTPTLAMIVKRQEEIDNFVKTDFFGVKANGNISWKATKESNFFESDLLYNENGFLKKSDAENLIKEFEKSMQLTVSDVKTQTKTEYAPYLFNLADLQAYCSKVFKISPAETLAVAQNLYEKKFTTYPRTDSRFLTTAVANELKTQGYDVPKRYVDDGKVTDHYALMPTFYGNPSSLSGIEKSVYATIVKRFEDILKPPYIYDSTTVTYKHNNGEPFYESFKNVKQYGFREKTDEDSKKTVPNKGDILKVSSYALNLMETKPPVAYTTGSLILAMEKAGKLIEDEELREQIKTSGIGTSATRAGIIEKLTDKNFISIDKSQKITPTETGKRIIPIIEKFDSQLTSPEKTAEMEGLLNAIVNGEISADDYERKIKQYVTDTTKNILSSNKEKVGMNNTDGEIHSYDCPCCSKELKHGRYGFYCDKNSDGCGFSFGNEICGHKMKGNDLEDLINKGKTKVYSFKSKAGKSFKASLVLDRNNHQTSFEFEKPKKYER